MTKSTTNRFGKTMPLAGSARGRTPPGANDTAALTAAQAAGQRALRPALSPLPAKDKIDPKATYAVTLNYGVGYRGRTLTPGHLNDLSGELLLDDTVRGAVRACAKLT